MEFPKMELMILYAGCKGETDLKNGLLDSVRGVSEASQLYLTLCDPMDCSPPGSSVDGIFQARVLEWVAISFSRRSS